MDSRLNNTNMKKNIIIFSSVILALSCNVNKLPRFDYNNGPNPWINAFKDRVFITCLSQSYPKGVSDSIFNLISKYDLYNPYDDFIDYEINNKRFLDSLGASIPKKAPPFWHIDEPDNKGKNVNICNCLHYYASRELDSIAISEYKKVTKNNN